MTIKNIFLPEEINGYFVLKTKMVSLFITDNAIFASIFTCKGKVITYEQSYKEVLSDKGSVQDRMGTALKKILSQIKKPYKITIVYPGTFVVFKQMELPFLERHKIQLVLNYELESILPFSATEAAFDFIITKQQTDKSTSSIMIAATQKKHLDDFLKPYSKIGIDLDHVSVDAFDFFGLVQQLVPLGLSLKKTTCLMFGETVQILSFRESLLSEIRVLPINQFSTALCKEILYTIQSFQQKDQNNIQEKIFSLGHTEDQLKTIKEETGLLVEPLPYQLLFKNNTIQSSQTRPEIPAFSAFSAAFPNDINKFFDLKKNTPSIQQTTSLNKQIGTAAALIFGIFLILSIHTVVRIRNLSVIADESEQSVLTTIKKHFPTMRSENLSDAANKAMTEVKQEEAIWSSFSPSAQQSFLKCLYELSRNVDREGLGLVLKNMSFSKNVLRLEGKVKDFTAITKLEEQLKETQLFSHIPDLQKVEFSIDLPLKRGSL